MGFVNGQLVVGCKDGSLYLFKGRKLDRIVSAHGASVTTIRTHAEGLVTGGLDCSVMMWNTTLAQVGEAFCLPNTCEIWQPPKVPGRKNRRGRIASVDYCNSNNYDKSILIGTRGGDIVEVKMNDNTMHLYHYIRAHCGGELWGIAEDPHQAEFATCGDDKVRISRLDNLFTHVPYHFI